METLFYDDFSFSYRHTGYYYYNYYYNNYYTLVPNYYYITGSHGYEIPGSR